MTCDLLALRVDAADPVGVATFWAGMLGWEQPTDRDDVAELLPTDGTGFGLRFRESSTPKTVANLMHFDLTSTSLQAQQATVTRAIDLGACHIDVGQRPEEGHVVLADPEGNELCVLEPGNQFLADCGFVGALACDGTQAVGYFWSRALGWPLVWDQDQETAIRSPHGGPKITWGGPPLAPKADRNRVAFELTVAPAGDLAVEVERLVSLGAARGEGGTLIDPDGNEFRVERR